MIEDTGSNTTRRRLIAALACLPISVAPRLAGAQAAAHQHHRFQDAERWSRVFDDPRRDVWQLPDKVIAALRLKPDSLVADIGAGTGYFAARLARAVPNGKVYAVDLEPDMVAHLAQRARSESLPNLVAVAGAADDPKLPTAVDLVLLVNAYHHIDDRRAYFERLRAALRPGGRLAIIDSLPDAPSGPPRASRIPAQRVIDELDGAGYRVDRHHDWLPYQYFIEFALSG